MNYIVKIALCALVITTGCDQDGVEIDSRGGVVVSDDGRFSLEIPEGALDGPVAITLDEVPCEQDGTLGPCYEVGPIGLPLNFPATVTYNLDTGMLDGVDVTELEVLTADEVDWHPLADRQVDMGDESVSASAVYLSSYMVVVD